MFVAIMGLYSHALLIAVITTCSIAQVLQPSDAYSGDNSGFGCKCPKECFCTDTDVDCSAKNLTSVPKDFNDCYWANIKLLNLSYNFITQIGSESFVNFPNLDSLLLYSNRITYLDSGAFLGLSQLTVLSLDGNFLTTLHINVFKSLTNLQRLLLYNNHISSLTPGIFDSLEKLIILAVHENRLTYLDERLFGDLRNLQRLYIQGNQITDISNAPFRALHKLQLLYLDNNRLRSLTNSSLTGLSSVYALVLRNNQITEISSGTFVHMPNLLYLYMDYNRLQRLSKNQLKHLGKLRILTANGNQLQTIDDGAFVQQPYLHTLYLHANRLDTVTAQTFTGLKSLQEIVLYSNKITTLPSRFLIDSRQLRRLWLQQNNIRCISETSFMGLDRLELIHLSSNEISYLPNNVFQYTPNLFYIILTNNNISEIKTRPFRNLTRLIQLALFQNSIKFIADGSFEGSNRLFYLQWNSVSDFSQDNRLACDCSSLWLKEYLLRVRPYYETVYCRMQTDDGARGYRLVSAPIEARDCFRGIKLTVTPDVSTIFVKNGSCLELQCRSNVIANIAWSRLKGSKQPLTVGGQGCQRKGDLCGNIDTEGLITIPQFTYKDEGFYVCTGTRDNDTSYELRHVLIREPPIIHLTPKNQQYRNPPSYILFNVLATGNPKPSFKWYKDLNPINTTDDKYFVGENGSLIILDPIQEDSGVYKFVADNGAGSVETSATLTIYFASICNQGKGCQNGGTCVSYYQCHCINGYTGHGCDDTTVAPTTQPTAATTQPPIYSGDYYYYSGDYYYYSGDYYYDDTKRKKRGVPQYDYDFVDMSSKEYKKRQRLARRKTKVLKAKQHLPSRTVPKQSYKSIDSSTKVISLPHKIKAEPKIDLWTLPKDIVPNPNVQDLKH